MSKMSELDIEIPELGVLTGDTVVDNVIKKLYTRSKAGMIKYGTTMEGNKLDTGQWIDHAIEEALDFANYLERLKIDVANMDKVIAQVMKDMGAINARRATAEEEKRTMQLELDAIGERL